MSSSVYQITVENSQSVATPSPFQQLLQLDLSSVLSSASDLPNLQFSLDSDFSSYLYAYVESYSSDLSQVNIWVSLPNGIGANSSITIYMQVGSSSNYPYTGVSPLVAQQLSLSGDYDNGANVFPYYQSFAGLSALPSGWELVYNSASSSLTFETYYLEITDANENNGITQSSSSSFENLIVDFLVQLNSFSGAGSSIIGIGLGQADTTSTYFIGGGGGALIGNTSDGVAFGYNNNDTENTLYEYVGTNDVNNFSVPTSAIVLSIELESDETYFYYNYSTEYSTTDVPGTFDLPITVIKQTAPTDMYLYTIKTRSIPPNNTMPSVSMSSSTSSSSPSSSTSSQANEAVYFQQITTISTQQQSNEAFYISPVVVKPTLQSNEAFYIQPITVKPTQQSNEAFYIQPITVKPTQQSNEAFFFQPVTIVVTHITIPEFVTFLSIQQGIYNDIQFTFTPTSQLQIAPQYEIELQWSISVTSELQQVTVTTRPNYEQQIFELGIGIPTLYYLGKYLIKAIKRISERKTK